MSNKKVIFVCTHNAGKSRLAEAYLMKIADGRVEAASAGLEPSEAPNPAAVEVAASAGIHLRPGPGVALSRQVVDGADLIVAFGCGVEGVETEAPIEDWALVDDEGRPLKDYEDIRDAITQRVDDLWSALNDRHRPRCPGHRMQVMKEAT